MTIAPLVLVVDDEPQIRRLLHATLDRTGYRVAVAANADEAMAALAVEDPAVVLLDLGLPDRDGLELVPAMQKRSRAAIIVVSARDDTTRKVTALDLGAVDYVTKPFDTEELLARLRAALRGRLTAEGGRSRITVGTLGIDLVDHRVTRDGAELHLTPKEFGLLAALARFPGRAITHKQLLDAVWTDEEERYVEYLRVMVRNLRRKLEDDPSRPAIIVSEPGVGYRLMGAAD